MKIRHFRAALGKISILRNLRLRREKILHFLTRTRLNFEVLYVKFNIWPSWRGGYGYGLDVSQLEMCF